MNSDELGEKGESRFREICADAGLVCNPSTRDRSGWDFIVEFGIRKEDKFNTLDKRASPISAHVQVKTMWASGDKFSMRLSSAELLAKEPKPSFVYILKVSDALEFTEAYLLHMRDNNLAKVLRRLRSEQRNGGKQINHKKISYHASKSGRLLEPTGAALRAALIECCGLEPQKYIQTKTKQLEGLGFGSRPYTLNMTMVVDDVREVSEAFLGFKEIEASVVGGFETRFGITLPDHTIPVGPSAFRFMPQPKERCSVMVRGGDNSELPVTFSAEVIFTPKVIPDRMILIKTLFFQLLVSLSDRSVKFSIFDEVFKSARYKTSEWIDFIKMLMLLSKGGGRVEIRPSRFPLIPINVTDFKVDLRGELPGLLGATEGLRKILGLIALRELEVGIDDINTNIVQLFWLKELLAGRSNKAPLAFHGEFDPQITNGESPILYLQHLSIGEIHIGYYAIAQICIEEGERNVFEIESAQFGAVAQLFDVPRDFQRFIDEAERETGIKNTVVLEAPKSRNFPFASY
ncbi:MAG: hypothetical protein K8R18_14020 [Parvibaculum sp.]|uniref:hypothetical protein n=1 Tax=Parvibaculum sp. TaxID=2024848 RepID=UPI0025EF3B89|nr:hypothetical protein [Parvibaculum sp.]MCE9650733.1 hypothetical protein [Parvibaculum sp.]